MGKNAVVGIIQDENGLADIIERNARDFTYKNELGELVVYSFFEDINTLSTTRQHFEALFKAITEKLLEKGIPVKGFIFTKDSIVALQEDDCTAYIIDWPATILLLQQVPTRLHLIIGRLKMYLYQKLRKWATAM